MHRQVNDLKLKQFFCGWMSSQEIFPRLLAQICWCTAILCSTASTLVPSPGISSVFFLRLSGNTQLEKWEFSAKRPNRNYFRPPCIRWVLLQQDALHQLLTIHQQVQKYCQDLQRQDRAWHRCFLFFPLCAEERCPIRAIRRSISAGIRTPIVGGSANVDSHPHTRLLQEYAFSVTTQPQSASSINSDGERVRTLE